MLIATFSLSAQTMGPKDDCTITGPSYLEVGQQYQFSVSANAQCSLCYDWDISSFNLPTPASIVGDDRQQTVTIQINSPGAFELKVTFFDESGCHSCQRNLVGEEDCFDPIIEGKLDCGIGGFVFLDSSTQNLSNVDQVTWTFDPNDNGSYYAGFNFTSGGTIFNGGQSITSTNSSTNYEVQFGMNSGATCPSNKYICFDLVVDFIDGSVCEEEYWIGPACGNLTIPQPLSDLSISPNPAADRIFVEINEKKGSTLEFLIYDLRGMLLTSTSASQIPGNTYLQELELPQTTDKMLILKILEGEHVIQTEKIILE